MRPVLALLAILAAPAAAASGTDLCRMLEQDATVTHADATLEVGLAREGLASYEEIFTLIEGLFEAEAIDRMSYLRARYDRDSARSSLDAAHAGLERQQALLDYYRATCDGRDGEALRAMLDRFDRAECRQQVQRAEAARIDLEFHIEWLASVQELRRSQVAVKQDIILAELDVTRSRLRLSDAESRAEPCSPD